MMRASRTHESGWSGECGGCCLFLLAVPGGFVALIGLWNIDSIASGAIERLIFGLPLMVLVALAIAAAVILLGVRHSGKDSGHPDTH